MTKEEEKGTLSIGEFQEIAHSGGKVTIQLETDKNGRKQYSIGIEHSNPNPAAWFGIYAIPQGVPVETIKMGGIGQPWNSPPMPDCFPIFIGSDKEGLHGHSCPICHGYWRSNGIPSGWFMTCPYCGNKAKTHEYLTEGQVKFTEACCDFYTKVIESKSDGSYTIDLDKIADDVSKGIKKPDFYYTEESQQNKYTCGACGVFNDIIGGYGFCSICGTLNVLQEFLEKIIPSIRKLINKENSYETSVKEVVSSFDSLIDIYIKHMTTNTPMTPARKDRLRKLQPYHNLQKVADEIKSIFDIDIFKDLIANDIEFSKRMFHRRHVYEHKGGVADKKYLEVSGEKNVREGQALRESKESAHKITNISIKMLKNIHEGFHSIFPSESMAIKNT